MKKAQFTPPLDPSILTALQQESMSVEEYTYQFMELACYAPEEVDRDEKKQDMFKKGLSPELWTLLTPQIYPDFNTLMNMASLTERAKAEVSVSWPRGPDNN